MFQRCRADGCWKSFSSVSAAVVMDAPPQKLITVQVSNEDGSQSISVRLLSSSAFIITVVPGRLDGGCEPNASIALIWTGKTHTLCVYAWRKRFVAPGTLPIVCMSMSGFWIHKLMLLLYVWCTNCKCNTAWLILIAANVAALCLAEFHSTVHEKDYSRYNIRFKSTSPADPELCNYMPAEQHELFGSAVSFGLTI